jgi:hypothetical protein
MSLARRLLVPIVLAAATWALLGACNTGAGDCPAKEAIQPGAACDDDQLQCAYDLPTPSAACDGTTTVIATSCTCTKKAWSCPSPFVCGEGAAGDDAAKEAGSGDDASEVATDDDGGSDAPQSDSGEGGS